jgi:hypothetical protein
MVRVIRETLDAEVNVPDDGLVQFVPALGAAILGRLRLQALAAQAGDSSGAAAGARA